MNILVVSGFLGSGKTTFISTLAKKTKNEFLVMENEYGSEGIDGDILRDDRLKVWELTEGCICCSLKGDFASSILTIANTVDVEYLVVEPTGLGLLSSIMKNISRIEYDRIKLLSPVTVVDVHAVSSSLNKFATIYTDQIKNATIIVLSKVEDALPREKDEAIAIIRYLNPKACLIEECYEELSTEWWAHLFTNFYRKEYQKIDYKEDVDFENLENISLKDVSVESVTELLEIIVAILRGFFGAIYRAKGCLDIEGYWTRFDVVDKRYSVVLSENRTEAKVVLIGQKLDKKKIYKAFGLT